MGYEKRKVVYFTQEFPVKQSNLDKWYCIGCINPQQNLYSKS